MIFGKKELFAIELTDYNEMQVKAKLRLWLNGDFLGKMREASTLSHTIYTIKSLCHKDDGYYDDIFETMTHKELFEPASMVKIPDEIRTVEDYARAQQVLKFVSFFGDQIDDISILTYFKEQELYFIWVAERYDGTTHERYDEVKSTGIAFHEFKKVCDDFLFFVGATMN